MPEPIITKTCRTCKEIKPISEFPKRKDSIDGYRNDCKKCQAIIFKAYKLANADEIKAYQKSYSKSERGKSVHRRAHLRYWTTDTGKASQRKNAANQRIKRPYAIKAMNAVNHAIAAGKIPRADSLKCKCGEQAKEYHHPSYAKKHWLDVIPKCRQCHVDIHKDTPSSVCSLA